MADSDTIIDYVDFAANKFQERVLYIACKTAIAILYEDPSTPDHEARVDFAGSILAGDMDTRQLAIGLATQAAVSTPILDTPQTDPTDAQLESTLSAIFTAYALSVT